jgi:hypothetical protein
VRPWLLSCLKRGEDELLELVELAVLDHVEVDARQVFVARGHDN